MECSLQISSLPGLKLTVDSLLVQLHMSLWVHVSGHHCCLKITLLLEGFTKRALAFMEKYKGFHLEKDTCTNSI